jgi:hypothetical protein
MNFTTDLFVAQTFLRLAILPKLTNSLQPTAEVADGHKIPS